MPRTARSYNKTSFFHVITQGINKSYIFENPEDIKFYINTMYKLQKEQEIKIIAYCIMNNHTHILINVKDVHELSKYMQRLNIKYSSFYNNKYERVGYVFRDRYKAEGIYSEKYYYNCMRYIYNNPVKAGICTNPADYPYSNYTPIPKDLRDDCYLFLDVDDNNKDNCKEIIKVFLLQEKIELSELQSDKIKLKELIKLLKQKNNISLRCIAEVMNINREKIRKIYNE